MTEGARPRFEPYTFRLQAGLLSLAPTCSLLKVWQVITNLVEQSATLYGLTSQKKKIFSIKETVPDSCFRFVTNITKPTNIRLVNVHFSAPDINSHQATVASFFFSFGEQWKSPLLLGPLY
jgi:hypothetical protein